MRNMIIISLSMVSMSCATLEANPNVYNSPSLYEDQVVSMCGVMVGGPEIVPRRGSSNRISIVELGPLEHSYRGPLCLTGKIVYLGCESGEVICFGAVRDYGVEIQSVLIEE